VNQSNSAINTATATNTNATIQALLQGSAKPGALAKYGMFASLLNGTSQAASAAVLNIQANIYAPVSVFSPGANSGAVNQSNTATNTATATNTNTTDQSAAQALAGGSGGGGQDASLSNGTDQAADASIWNAQFNIFAPVAVFSPGANSGAVTQSNTATNTATASNDNDTTQSADQAQAGGSGAQQGILVNYTEQEANGQVLNIQANIYAPVTVFGSSMAGMGAVSQSNTATNTSTSSNVNSLVQQLMQGMGIFIFRF
jgi:hypothetical protein